MNIYTPANRFPAGRLKDTVFSGFIRKLSFLLLYTLFTLPQAFAHGGQIELGGGARGPVHLTDRQKQAIALQTAPADIQEINKELNINGQIELLPNRQADVSLRISGQVKVLYTNLGDKVRVGQRLAKVESRLSGNPPPNVNITAPMSGVIDARNVNLGQAVEPNMVLFHISDRSRLIVVAKVYEEDIGKIELGQEANIRVLSYPKRIFNGKVTLIDPTLDPLSRTVDVWIEMSNEKDMLKPNMFTRVSVIIEHDDAALVVPNGAIIEANGERFVFVAENNTYQRVEVTIGAHDDKYSQIIDGLVPGDEVVLQGNRQVYTRWLTGSGQQSKGEKD